MATDSLSALKAELTAAIAALDPEILDVDHLSIAVIDQDLAAALRVAEGIIRHRRDLVQTCLNDIAQLNEDLLALANEGYPNPEVFTISPELLAQLGREIADLNAGAAVFTGGQPERGDFNPQRSVPV